MLKLWCALLLCNTLFIHPIFAQDKALHITTSLAANSVRFLGLQNELKSYPIHDNNWWEYCKIRFKEVLMNFSKQKAKENYLKIRNLENQLSHLYHHKPFRNMSGPIHSTTQAVP